jgi:hypothetical protein
MHIIRSYARHVFPVCCPVRYNIPVIFSTGLDWGHISFFSLESQIISYLRKASIAKVPEAGFNMDPFFLLWRNHALLRKP